MINWFKRKPTIYKKETSAEEVYQQEHFYKIIIEDRAKALENNGDPEELVNKLYEAIPHKSVKKELKLLLGTRRYEYDVGSFGYGRDRVVEVVITNKRHRNMSLFRGRK